VPLRPAAITAQAAAAVLHRLLEHPPISQPVVLVGHSLQGLYSQYFARHYPSQVAAVVLIDADSPFEPLTDPRFQTRATLEPGVTDYWKNAGVETSILQTRQSPPFPPIPLSVLTATDHSSPQAFEQEWRHIQAQTAAQSPLGRQVVAQGSGHYIHNDQPAFVIDHIRQLVLQLRHDL
jgi:pimeloyl-ACP methyl ester carboxylesterase